MRNFCRRYSYPCYPSTIPAAWSSPLSTSSSRNHEPLRDVGTCKQNAVPTCGTEKEENHPARARQEATSTVPRETQSLGEALLGCSNPDGKFGPLLYHSTPPVPPWLLRSLCLTLVRLVFVTHELLIIIKPEKLSSRRLARRRC